MCDQDFKPGTSAVRLLGKIILASVWRRAEGNAECRISGKAGIKGNSWENISVIQA